MAQPKMPLMVYQSHHTRRTLSAPLRRTLSCNTRHIQVAILGKLQAVPRDDISHPICSTSKTPSKVHQSHLTQRIRSLYMRDPVKDTKNGECTFATLWYTYPKLKMRHAHLGTRIWTIKRFLCQRQRRHAQPIVESNIFGLTHAKASMRKKQYNC